MGWKLWESISVSYIQDYFEYILKNNEEKTESFSIRICVYKIGNRITFAKVWNIKIDVLFS